MFSQATFIEYERDNGGVKTIMRIIALIISVIIISAFIAVQPVKVQAESSTLALLQTSYEDEADDIEGVIISQNNRYLVAFIENADQQDDLQENDLEPEPIEHIVSRGETLTSIAREYDTEWIRLWHANEDLEHPDVLSIDQKLHIPFADDELEERELPEPQVVEQLNNDQDFPTQETPERRESTQNINTQQQNPQPRSSSGNLYSPGYCTWYVKNRRPDLPNNLGNANTWVARASTQGLKTGSSPRVGAVAYQPASGLGHVAYVEAVHNDGTVTISEMNWSGRHVITERRVSATTFTYIY